MIIVVDPRVSHDLPLLARVTLALGGQGFHHLWEALDCAEDDTRAKGLIIRTTVTTPQARWRVCVRHPVLWPRLEMGHPVVRQHQRPTKMDLHPRRHVTIRVVEDAQVGAEAVFVRHSRLQSGAVCRLVFSCTRTDSFAHMDIVNLRHDKVLRGTFKEDKARACGAQDLVELRKQLALCAKRRVLEQHVERLLARVMGEGCLGGAVVEQRIGCSLP
mmetsp:Transcript_36540/g.72787  ORF Transcript_36540/g.72787 Transcript_36540/m.72787 type:complete len:216 (-) Transcript_36540:557-1204(-)